MIKNKKNLVLLIILGFLFISGFTYFKVKKSTTKNVEVNNNSSVDTSKYCKTEDKAWIKVLSPNGGEVYQAGQQVTVKWKTCNLLRTDQIAIGLLRQSSNGFNFIENSRVYNLQNDGTEIFTLPSNEKAGLVYRIDVDLTRNTEVWDINDESDNLFTITIPNNVSTKLPTPYFSSSDWPPATQNSSVSYSCTPVTLGGPDEPKIVVSQKVINNRTYCITIKSDYGMNHSTSEYTYVIANGSGTKIINFTLINGNCSAYDTPSSQIYDQCQAEKTNFNLDAIIDSIM